MKLDISGLFSKDKKSKGTSQWEGFEPTLIAIDLVESGLVKEGTHVLDLGCGFGRNSNWLASKGAIVDAINNNEEELRKAKDRAEKLGVEVNYVNADAGLLPFPDASFDVFLDAGCTHMCDHIKQDESVNEAARVVKKGGYLKYFGFNKKHPEYQKHPESAQFRDLEDVVRQYGEFFEIIREPIRQEWKNGDEKHVGLEILMKRR